MRGLPRIAFAIATAVLLGTPTIAIGAEPAGVTFVDSSDLSLKVDAEQAVQASVELVNGSPSTQTITLSAANVAPAGAFTVSIVSPPQELAPGETKTWAIEITAATEQQTATAELVAASDDGSIARRAVSVKIGEPPIGPVPNSEQLRQRLPKELVAQTESWLPTPLVELAAGLSSWPHLEVGPCLACGWVADVNVPVDPSVRLTSSATLAGPDADLATVWQTDQSMFVYGLRSAGEYTGSIEVAEEKTADLKVQVRDFVFWPTLMLFLGLLLATWVDAQLGRALPYRDLLLRLEIIKKQVQDAQRSARDDLDATEKEKEPNDPSLPSPYEIWRAADPNVPVGGGEGGLAVQARQAGKEFEADDPETAQKAWSPTGESYGDLADLPKRVMALNKKALAAWAALAQLRRSMRDDWDDFSKRPIATGISTAFKGGLLKSVEDLTAAEEALEKASELLAVAADAWAQVNDYLKDSNVTPEQAAELERVRKVMLTSRLDSVDEIKEKVVSVAEKNVPVDSPKRRAARDYRELLVQQVVDANVFGTQLEYLLPADWWKGRATSSEGPAKNAPNVLQRIVRWVFDQFRTRGPGVVSGVLVLGSGLSTLYFTKATFGSTGDYLALLVWGTAVGGGVALAKRIGPLAKLVQA